MMMPWTRRSLLQIAADVTEALSENREMARLDGDVVDPHGVDENPADRHHRKGDAVEAAVQRDLQRHWIDQHRDGQTRDQRHQRRQLRRTFEYAQHHEHQRQGNRGEDRRPSERAGDRIVDLLVHQSPLYRRGSPSLRA
jgi:stalled ribosome alternative rescue factor ArfA